MPALTRREFLCSGAAAVISGPQRFEYGALYYVSNYVVARGNTHIHTIASNDAADRAVIEAYLRNRPKLTKVDFDHLPAEDIDATVARANRLGLNFLLTQDHGEKLSDAHYLRQGSYHGKLIAPLTWGNSPTGIGNQYHSGMVSYRGFEWTQGGLFSTRPLGKARTGVINHVGVFGASKLTGTTLRPGTAGTPTPDFTALCQWFTTQEPGRVIASFNHPGYGNNQFNDFTVAESLEAAKAYLRMIELGSGADAFYEGISQNEQYYIRALQHGWRVMPTIGIDNWGKLTPAARDRHVALWSSGFFGPSQNFLNLIAHCQGYASEIRDLVVVFGLTGVHADPSMPQESGKALMGQLATPCALGEPIKAFWQMGTVAKTNFSELGIVTVLPSRTEYTPLTEIRGALPLTLAPDVIGYYLKGTASGGRRFITAPVFILHRNTEITSQAHTEPFGTIRAKLTGFRVEDKTSPPVLLPLVPPALELTWERADQDWQIEVDWEVAGIFSATQRLDYSDLDKRRAKLFDPYYRKKEVPLERFGDYRINVFIRERLRRSSTKLVLTVPFRVANRPLTYIPDRLRTFRSL